MSKRYVGAVTILLLAYAVAVSSASGDSAGQPQYTANHELIRPADYRNWVFLSSGLGMSYNPAAGGHDMFTNVFVPQASYQEFLKSGHWPEPTMFVVEEREAESKGSINQHGHYQVDLMGIGVEVKDSKHFPEKWAYFSFDGAEKTASANPREGCFACHDAHAAVEHTFVQFYPTLKPISQKFGTYNAEREKVTSAR